MGSSEDAGGTNGLNIRKHIPIYCRGYSYIIRTFGLFLGVISLLDYLCKNNAEVKM